MTNLQAEDGTPLNVKEGILLAPAESESNSASEPHSRFRNPSGRVFVMQSRGVKISPLAWVFLIPLAVLLCVIGITFFAAIAAVTLVLFTVTKIVKQALR